MLNNERKDAMKKLITVSAVAVLLSGAFAVPATAATTTIASTSWGLDRIDQQSSELDNRYTSPESGGAGVRVYVLDTGVQGDLPNFENRVEEGFDATSQYGGKGNIDCHGHGTHVAGIIASSKYGVAPKATIVPVKVATCRGGVSSGWITTALNWVLDNHPAGTPGVVNMSIAVRHNPALNDLTDKLYRQGLVVTAAAGNYNMDACSLSPGSTESILTVGSINMSDNKTRRTTYGDCIDIYAPGGLIESEDPRAESRTRIGTSMAAPHVAGAAALYLADHPGESAAMFNHLVKMHATQGAIKNVISGSSLLLNIGFINERSGGAELATTPQVEETPPAPVIAEPAPEVEESKSETTVTPSPDANAIADAPIRLTISGNSRMITLNWDAPANIDSVTIRHYAIEYSLNKGRSWRTLGRVEATGGEFRNPTRGRMATFKVTAVTAGGDSEASSPVTVRIR
jgi:subtilisin family serine protease